MAFNSFRPSESSTPIVLNLIIINVIVFIAQMVLDNSALDPNWFTNFLALYPFNTSYFEPYQLVTHMFAHGGFLHILFNMYALWLFGAVLERKWGPKKFLIFYFACGLAAGVTQMLLSPAPAIGASGAIMGLLAAFAFTFPNVEFYIIPFPFPIKAKWLAIIYGAIDIFGGFFGIGDNIAHFAHLGGLIMGLILAFLWNQNQKKTTYY
ncbi:MAG: rhomboid family intramembrane serine protease [Ginsengibacter sp.]|jgi:membrane associated rhomboid family serine protease